MIAVEIIHPSIPARRLELDEGVYVLGRGEQADIKLPVPSVSSVHAELSVTGRLATIRDLGGLNGIEIDGAKVLGSVAIAPGKKVKFGGAELTVVPLLAGESGTGYERGAMIARGGMGQVYEALQGGMDSEVAMKVIRGSADEDSVTRFVNEARVTGWLEHPNIVPVHELGTDANGQPFYTMKYVKGVTLANIIQQLKSDKGSDTGDYSLAALLTIFQKVCDAISFAHSRGVIHRDLKPENIMIGGHGEVLVMDWGVAKLLGEDDGAIQPSGEDSGTMQGSLVGTPAYMSPEQARGEVQDIDARADIFSLARILYEILYLQRAVSGESSLDIVRKVASGERDPFPEDVGSAHLPDRRVPEALAAVCEKAMAEERENRYSSVDDLQCELSAYQGGFATAAQAASPLTHLRLLVNRHRGIASSLAASVILLATMAIVFVLHVMRERDDAEGARAFAEEETGRKQRALIENQNLLDAVDEGELALAQSVQDLRVKNAELEREQVRLEATLADLGSAGDKAINVASRLPAIREAQGALVEELAETHAMLSNALAREGKLDESLESARQALLRKPSDARYALGLGKRLQLSGNFSEAASLYERALEAGGDDQAKRLLELARKAEKEVEERGGISHETFAAHKRLMAELGEIEESAAAIQKLAETTKGASPEETQSLQERLALQKRILLRLDEYRALPGWKDDRVKVTANLTAEVNLENLGIGSVPDLSGLPITNLSLHRCKLTDVRPLRGLKLRWLDIGANHELEDISPLQGMPLEYLSLWGNGKIQDFSPISNLTLLKDLRLPPHCCGLDCSRLKQLEFVQHYRFKPGHWSRLEADTFILLSRLSDEAWQKWGSSLMRMDVEDMRRDRVTVLARQSKNLEKGFELDLRGTGVANLAPVARMPVRELHIDTAGATPVDLSPLARMKTLRVLNLKHANAKEMRPSFPLAGLESLTVSRNALDLNLLAKHPTLKYVSYEYDQNLQRADVEANEFFISKSPVQLDRTGLLFEESFDDFSRGIIGWFGVDDEGGELDVMWPPS